MTSGRNSVRSVSGLLTLVALAGALFSYGCQSSSQQITAPGGKKCEISVPGSLPPVGPQGGSGSLTITAARECVWTVASGAAWITISNDRTGQGPGVVHYTAAANPTPAARRGTLIVDDRQVELMQDAAPCQFTFTPSGLRVGPAGDDSVVAVNTLAGCAWTAVTETGWIALVSPAGGSGPGEVRVQTQPNNGAERTGQLRIAGQIYTVTQESPTPSGCVPVVASLQRTVAAAGGALSVGVSAVSGCSWTAISHVPWIAVVQGAGGAGNANVVLSVEPNTGPQRVGTVVIAGQTVTVTQSSGTSQPPPCSIELGSAGQSIAAGGGDVTIPVTASTGCPWTATTQAAWITITQGASGSGNGAVTLAVAANTGPQRVGTVTVAGRTFTVTQAAAASPPSCSFSLSSAEQVVATAGGPVTVGVSGAAGCAWTATTAADWITITNGAQGSGAGSVTLTVAANSGAERSGTVTIAGQTFTVKQAGISDPPPPCSYSLTSAEQSVDAAGGPVTVGVSTPAGCAWTATTEATWIAIESGAQGTGPGSVTLTVAANTGASRSGTVTIVSQTFTVVQAAAPPPPCSYSLAPTEHSVANTGGAVTVGVTTADGCAWTAVSEADWITVTAGSAGTGSGTVSLSAAANTGPERVGTVLIAGHTFTVTQAAICSYSVNPTEQPVPSLGGTFSVAITTQPGCTWAATANVSWITITSSSSGAGSDTVTYRVSPGTIVLARQGTLTVAGQTVTVSQVGLLGLESQSATSGTSSVLPVQRTSPSPTEPRSR